MEYQSKISQLEACTSFKESRIDKNSEKPMEQAFKNDTAEPSSSDIIDAFRLKPKK